jgi:thioredoxin 1
MDEITPKNFNRRVLKSKRPVLVYFTGHHCYPCKRIEPILIDLSKEMRKEMKFVKFMVDEDSFDFTERFNLNAVPTLLIFSGGVMTNSLVGFVPRAVLRTFLEESITLSGRKNKS